MRKTFSLMFACCLIGSALAVSGCIASTPERTVRSYLQMLSGERKVTEASLEKLTTEHYRTTDHPHLASLAKEQREKTLDLADELREDPAILELMELIKWETTYDVVRQDDTSAHVVARVILSERKKGNREVALKIPDLPEALVDVLEEGLELPFQFDLVKENGKWKIDDFAVPDILIPLLDISEDIKGERS